MQPGNLPFAGGPLAFSARNFLQVTAAAGVQNINSTPVLLNGLSQSINPAIVVDGEAVSYVLSAGLAVLDPVIPLPPPAPAPTLATLVDYAENIYQVQFQLDISPSVIPSNIVPVLLLNTFGVDDGVAGSPVIKDFPFITYSGSVDLSQDKSKYLVDIVATYTPPTINPAFVLPPPPDAVLLQYFVIYPPFEASPEDNPQPPPQVARTKK